MCNLSRSVTFPQGSETDSTGFAMARRQLVEAVAYLRTSSATNVGPDKDSDKRQREAITGFAKRAGFDVVDTFTDEAVMGRDAIEDRPGFAALLDRIEGNGVRVVLIEDATRFARELIVQELGILALIGRGVRVITASGDDLTETDDPFKVAMRQIAGAFAQLEKARLVGKLKGARERKMKAQAERGEKVKCGGRRSYVEQNADMVALAKRLHRYPVNGRRRSLREVSAELATQGHVAASGKPFGAEAVRRMVGQG